jgi:hypothetical protein
VRLKLHLESWDMSKPLNPVEEGIIAKQLAVALLDGSPVSQAAKAVGIELSVARRIVKSEAFKELVNKAGDDSLLPALAEAKNKLAKLTSKAIKVIEYQLDENNLDAAKIVLKAVGVDKDDGKAEQDTVLNIIMPGATEPKSIDVEVE